MREKIFFLICIIFMISFVSAEAPVQLVITQQPDAVYNFGDSFSVPLTIKSLGEVTGILQMELICNGKQVDFYKNGVKLSTGEEQKENPILILTRENIGFVTGTCRIKATLQDKYILSNDFKISDKLTINLKTESREFNPEEEVIFEGEVLKENGQAVNGFIELNLKEGNSSQQEYLETISNGFFAFKITLPRETKAGQYLVNLEAYEKDSEEEKTNTGFMDFNIRINQIPTVLEIVFNNQEIIPGENLVVKGILHDQTGGKIDARVVMTIKNSRQKILEQKEMATDEEMQFNIKYNQAPENWTVFAVSNQLTSESKFLIGTKEDARVELINKTLIITNTGNVVYNKSISIKIGDNFQQIDALLKVDETKKYTLSAPEGEYEIHLVSDGNNEKLGSVALTGKAVNIEEYKSIEKILNPLVWLFIIAIFGFIAFLFFKKGYKRSFFGYINSFKKKPGEIKESYKKDKDRSTAALSLSLKGDKQDSSIITIKIKNLRNIENTSSVRETINKIITLAKDKKALLYENGDYLFFIFAPVITKTFRNEKNAVELSKILKNVIDKHNKIFQPKIEFGISANYGTIVAKPEAGILKFMTLGTFIAESKKIATLAGQEILLSKEMNNKLRSAGGIKTEKSMKNNAETYEIKDMRDSEEDKKFIGSFLKRLEK